MVAQLHDDHLYHHLRGRFWRDVLFHFETPQIIGPPRSLFSRVGEGLDRMDCGAFHHRDFDGTACDQSGCGHEGHL